MSSRSSIATTTTGGGAAMFGGSQLDVVDEMTASGGVGGVDESAVDRQILEDAASYGGNQWITSPPGLVDFDGCRFDFGSNGVMYDDVAARMSSSQQHMHATAPGSYDHHRVQVTNRQETLGTFRSDQLNFRQHAAIAGFPEEYRFQPHPQQLQQQQQQCVGEISDEEWLKLKPRSLVDPNNNNNNGHKDTGLYPLPPGRLGNGVSRQQQSQIPSASSSSVNSSSQPLPPPATSRVIDPYHERWIQQQRDETMRLHQQRALYRQSVLQV